MSTATHNGVGPVPGLESGSISPRTPALPKTVQFILVFKDNTHRARLPLRVSIWPHDSTDSIITTVKNFYGIYSGPGFSKGVSFEDEKGNILIARYENFTDGMMVFVRIIDQPIEPELYSPTSGPMYGIDPLSKPSESDRARTSRLRSPSPNGSGRGRRSTPAETNSTNGNSKKGRSRSSKNRGPQNEDGNADSANGYTSGDNAPKSSSGRKEQLPPADITIENIVEGGRRKRAKFESSELPLFAPPQMPAVTSNPSVSPVRRFEARHSLPYIQTGQNPFSTPRPPLTSPQSYNPSYSGSAPYNPANTDSRRSRGSFGYPSGQGMGPGMQFVPTPEPTVGSCMSEEDKDVAIQLMRLGEMSNHGRASASTVDDGFSGRADASSTGATSDAESLAPEDMHAGQRQKLDAMGNHKKIFNNTDGTFHAEASGDEADDSDVDDSLPPSVVKKPKATGLNGTGRARSMPANKAKTTKTAKPKLKKAPAAVGPMSPASLPASRKQSINSNAAFPLPLGEEETPDLSTKPRCQRCRKSKKGCDRQRPCGRCRDAGIPADQCISEDEGNGRKGRYGRHMGVPIKREDMPPPATAPTAAVMTGATTAAMLLPAAPIAPASAIAGLASPSAAGKDKKRKR